MVTTSKLSRRLLAFLLVWITGTLIVSFSLTHDDQALLDAGVIRSLLDEPEHASNTSSTNSDNLLHPHPQVQVPSPRMLVHQTDRKIHSRISSSKHQIHKEKKWHYFGKQGASRLPKNKNELPADFVSPAAGRATMCAVRAQHGCSIQPCQQQEDTMATAGESNDTLPVDPSDWHYGHGLVHRDNDLRGTSMMTSGQAKVGSGCAMSVKYKFIYIHVLKSAGMTIKAFLKRALCGGSTGNVTPCFESDELEHSDGHDAPAEPLLEIVNCAAALQEHPDYFVWSFVRNPFARLYSGYSMADDFRHRHHAGRRSNSAGNHDEQQHDNDMPAFTFSDFGTASQAGRSRLTSASNAHFLPQTNFLFSRASCPVFDFLGRLEHLDEDLQTVLQIVGSPELTDYVRAQNGTIHHERNTAYGSSKSSSELHGDLRNAYPSDGAVQAAAAVEYARDFKLLGYDPKVIPTTSTSTK